MSAAKNDPYICFRTAKNGASQGTRGAASHTMPWVRGEYNQTYDKKVRQRKHFTTYLFYFLNP